MSTIVTDSTRTSVLDDHNPNATIQHKHGIRVEKGVTIDKPAAELYAFWRNFENLPLFMEHLESVTTTSARTSHWVAKAPVGKTVEWDAEIINEIPDQLIAWRSLNGADIPNAGSIQFKPASTGSGTYVLVELEYEPPAGPLGVAVAKLFGEEPSVQIEEDLNRFKEYMETGQVPQTK